VIASPLQGNNGKPLLQTYHKHFFTMPDDRVRPSLDGLVLDLPDPNSQEPLMLNFREAMDWGALENKVWVEFAGQTFPTTLQATPQDSLFALIPQQAWQAGDYHLHFEASIEDLAGNNLLRLFDQDVTEMPPDDMSKPSVSFSLESH
ncbi:MAG: hypothetical protein AAF804_04500, partial [Bacteroidota bacterium]